MRAVVAYVPVIHRGYLDFLYTQRADRFYIVDIGLLNGPRSLQKDIRALRPPEAIAALSSFVEAAPLTSSAIRLLQHHNATLIMPDEDISRLLIERYFGHHDVELIPTFLRWDRTRTEAELAVEPDKEISVDQLDRQLMSKAVEHSRSSPDWWRQVGAAVVWDSEIVACAYNQPVPHKELVLYEGDPRANFRRGERIDLSTAMHAEAAVIAETARRGISLEGAKLYVSTFPCPPCAKLVAYSGIKEVYYSEGYAMVDGRRILQDKAVRVILVTM